jgi:hypothetical protein
MPRAFSSGMARLRPWGVEIGMGEGSVTVRSAGTPKLHDSVLSTIGCCPICQDVTYCNQEHASVHYFSPGQDRET